MKILPSLIILILLFSCGPDKKLTGTYVSAGLGTKFKKQIIHFVSDSTLQFVTIGNRYDSAIGNYFIVSGMVNILFDTINNPDFSVKNYPVLHLFPPYSSDTMYWQQSYEIYHHKLLNINYSLFRKEGYKYGEGHMWYINNTFHKVK